MKTMRHYTLIMEFLLATMITMNLALADMSTQDVVNQFNNIGRLIKDCSVSHRLIVMCLRKLGIAV